MLAEARINGLSLATRQRLAESELKEGVDLPRLERAVREILLAIGEDPERDGLLDTPKRVARSYRELFRGLRKDAAVHLRRTFTQEHGEAIILRDIEFSSICEHHLLPFIGKCMWVTSPREDRWWAFRNWQGPLKSSPGARKSKNA